MMHSRKFYSYVCPLCSAVTVARFGQPWRCSGRGCNARSTGVQDPEVKPVTIELTAAELVSIERLAEVMDGTLGDAVGAAVQSYANAHQRGKGR